MPAWATEDTRDRGEDKGKTRDGSFVFRNVTLTCGGVESQDKRTVPPSSIIPQTASKASVATLAIFDWPGTVKMLVGEPPQTRLFGTKCPKEVGCVTAAVAAVPYYFEFILAKTFIYKIFSSTITDFYVF